MNKSFEFQQQICITIPNNKTDDVKTFAMREVMNVLAELTEQLVANIKSFLIRKLMKMETLLKPNKK